MNSADATHECQHAVARVAAAQLDRLPISDRIMVCLGIASLYPPESREAISAKRHAEALRSIEEQQLLLNSVLNQS